jgi:putative tryptophan/tyrosine transport system substrate-binding protein
MAQATAPVLDSTGRRNFITLLGGTAAAWPLGAYGQQPPAKLPTVGFIGSDSPDTYTDRLRAFRLGLKSTGFIEGQNVTIEYRWAAGRNDKLPEFAVDLVRRWPSSSNLSLRSRFILTHCFRRY